MKDLKEEADRIESMILEWLESGNENITNLAHNIAQSQQKDPLDLKVDDEGNILEEPEWWPKWHNSTTQFTIPESDYDLCEKYQQAKTIRERLEEGKGLQKSLDHWYDKAYKTLDKYNEQAKEIKEHFQMIENLQSRDIERRDEIQQLKEENKEFRKANTEASKVVVNLKEQLKQNNELIKKVKAVKRFVHDRVLGMREHKSGSWVRWSEIMELLKNQEG